MEPRTITALKMGCVERGNRGGESDGGTRGAEREIDGWTLTENGKMVK